MSDVLALTGVSVTACHGVLPHEKETPQRFVVDVRYGLDLRPSGEDDALSSTVSYADVAADVVRVVSGPTVDLIETLAARVADAVLARDVEWCEVTIHKPDAPVGVPFDDVSVRIRRERSRLAVVALGANLGDPARTLAWAVRDLDGIDGVRVASVSSLYDTAPVGGPDQPRYLNAVATLTTRLAPHTLLTALHDIEARHGREREVRWGARTLDLDLIQLGDPRRDQDVRQETDAVTLPHPRAHQRAFVLRPWLDVAPTAVLRVGEDVRSVAELLQRLPDQGIEPGPQWPGRAWSGA